MGLKVKYKGKQKKHNIKSMNIVCIIPARGGSKTIHDKNIKLLMGKPLITYAIKAALHSKVTNKVIVSTDSEKILRISKKCGAEVPFLRPKKLAKDNTPDLPVFQHAIRYLEREQGYCPDIIVHLRATTPFRTGNDIDIAVRKLIKKNADGVRTVNLVTETPYWMDIINNDSLRSFIPGGRKYKIRQELPKVYRTNGLVDVVRRDIIMKKKSMYAKKNQLAIITERIKGLEIDAKLDFFIVEQVLKKRLIKI